MFIKLPQHILPQISTADTDSYVFISSVFTYLPQRFFKSIFTLSQIFKQTLISWYATSDNKAEADRISDVFLNHIFEEILKGDFD